MAVSNTSFESKKGDKKYPFGQGLLPPISDFIGFDLERASATSIEGRFVVSERSAQAFGVLHGGTSAFLGESLGSMGAFLASGMQRVAGVEFSTSHLQPAPLVRKLK